MGNRMSWVDAGWGCVEGAEMFGVTESAMNWDSERSVSESGFWQSAPSWAGRVVRPNTEDVTPAYWRSVRIYRQDEMVPAVYAQSLQGQNNNHWPRMNQLAIPFGRNWLLPDVLWCRYEVLIVQSWTISWNTSRFQWFWVVQVVPRCRLWV